VKHSRSRPLSIEIDKLTNSIEHAVSGKVFSTLILPFTSGEKNYRKREWVFDWKKELTDSAKQVFKLVTKGELTTIQGMLSITDKHDHIFMHLIESAKFNRGKGKTYKGVAGNLVAFACKGSFEKGYEGVVSFIAKTRLINHYESTLGAHVLSGNRMVIDTPAASRLVEQYFGA